MKEIIVPTLMVTIVFGSPTALLIWSGWKFFSNDPDGKLKAIIGLSFMLLIVGVIVGLAFSINQSDF